MSKSTNETNLLGVITQAFITFSSLQALSCEDNDEHGLFFSDSFPTFLRQQINNNRATLEPLNTDQVAAVLSQQDVEPRWCFIRLINGYVLFMRSEEQRKTLLQWVESDIGKLCAEEARQQNRFVDASHISLQGTAN